MACESRLVNTTAFHILNDSITDCVHSDSLQCRAVNMLLATCHGRQLLQMHSKLRLHNKRSCNCEMAAAATASVQKWFCTGHLPAKPTEKCRDKVSISNHAHCRCWNLHIIASLSHRTDTSRAFQSLLSSTPGLHLRTEAPSMTPDGVDSPF